MIQILQKKRKQLWKDNLFYRVKGVSWWEEEMPTQEENANWIR